MAPKPHALPDATAGPRLDQMAFLRLLNEFGYRVTPPHMRRLARYLSNAAGRTTPWSANYLLCVARGQLPASRQFIAAIETCASEGLPHPNATEYVSAVRKCPECGGGFVANVPWRVRCYECHPREGRRG